MGLTFLSGYKAKQLVDLCKLTSNFNRILQGYKPFAPSSVVDSDYTVTDQGQARLLENDLAWGGKSNCSLAFSEIATKFSLTLGTPVFKLPWIVNFGCFFHLTSGLILASSPLYHPGDVCYQSEGGRHM